MLYQTQLSPEKYSSNFWNCLISSEAIRAFDTNIHLPYQPGSFLFYSSQASLSGCPGAEFHSGQMWKNPLPRVNCRQDEPEANVVVPVRWRVVVAIR